MGLFLFSVVGLFLAFAAAQEVLPCSDDTTLFTVASSEDATALASLVRCSGGYFTAQWIGEVVVTETIRVVNGTSLNITGDGSGAVADGDHSTQLFVVEGDSSLHFKDMVFANGNASSGGAIVARGQSLVSFSGTTSFTGNSAGDGGGAIFTNHSTLLWDGSGDAMFSTNFALGNGGGAIYALWSDVYWEGSGGTTFFNNSAGYGYGGANGGAIYANGSAVFWDRDGIQFSYNSADGGGGAVYAYDSSVSWNCAGTNFSHNSGKDGGAMYLEDSLSSWRGEGTLFSHNSGGSYGGAIYATYSESASFSTASSIERAQWEQSIILWNGSTTFSNNSAFFGGALAFESWETFRWHPVHISGATFVGNTSPEGGAGGAVYMKDCATYYEFVRFEDATFQSNSAGAGGAVAAYGMFGTIDFSRCNFLGNTATVAGGAVDTIYGVYEFFETSRFEGNSAEVGGALNLGGTSVNDGLTFIRSCSFVANSASKRGFAIAGVDGYTADGSVRTQISSSRFEGNAVSCDPGFFMEEILQEGTNTSRYDAVCLECPTCTNCTVEAPQTLPMCSRPLAHSTADEPGVTLETLSISPGFWRVTNESYNILECFNTDACNGGITGTENFCANGYTGPYCAVCESGYSSSLAHTCTQCSSSRRQGLMAVTIAAALVGIFAILATFRYLLSVEYEEGDRGGFHYRVRHAFPLQAFKIIVVVWQILTQFGEVAHVTYPGVYDDFLRAIDVINFDLGSVISAGCLWSDIDFHDRLFVITIGPLVVVGILALTYVLALLRNSSAGSAIVDKIRHKHLTVLLLMTFLVYGSVSATVFKMFACDSLDDGKEYLRADYRILCTDAKHLTLQLYAGVMIMVYPVGIPLLYGVLLFQHRAVLADASADKTAAEPIASLWESYRPERFYYEIIECGRRILLTGVIVFIFPNDAAQIAINILIAVFFFAVFDVLSPYASKSDMWLSRGGQGIVFLSMFDLLLLKMDVSHERSQSQEAFAGVLVAGHVLMLLIIVAEVAGICYASRRNRFTEQARSLESFPGLRSRAGSDELPMLERVPMSWRPVIQQASASDKPGPARRVARSGTKGAL